MSSRFVVYGGLHRRRVKGCSAGDWRSSFCRSGDKIVVLFYRTFLKAVREGRIKAKIESGSRGAIVRLRHIAAHPAELAANLEPDTGKCCSIAPDASIHGSRQPKVRKVRLHIAAADVRIERSTSLPADTGFLQSGLARGSRRVTKTPTVRDGGSSRGCPPLPARQAHGGQHGQPSFRKHCG